MNIAIYNDKNIKNDTTAKINVSSELFKELSLLEIDPFPFYEIAAKDLLVNYGPSAIDLADQVISSFIKEENFESAEIWRNISQALLMIDHSSNTTAH